MLTVAGLQVPVMPLSERAGSEGMLLPSQAVRLVPKANVGVVLLLTVTDNVVGKAQSPVAGVKVYVPELVLLTVAGLHVPAMPLVEVAGKAGAIAPLQMDSVVPNANTGVTFGFTVTVKLAGSAQTPAAGVNVYVPLLLLSTVAGLHVPLIPLVDVAGNAGTTPPSQIVNVVPNINDGVTFGVMVTVNVAVVAHWLAAGVNV